MIKESKMCQQKCAREGKEEWWTTPKSEHLRRKRETMRQRIIHFS